MTFEQIIERNIETRTATRVEWHALRRHRYRRSLGLAYDVWLAPAVISGDLLHAAKAFLRSPEGQALQRISRITRMTPGVH
jgi:hypothetical protein